MRRRINLDGDDATLEMTKQYDSPLTNGEVSATTAKNGLFQMGEYKDGDKVTLVYEGDGSAMIGKPTSGKCLIIIFR